MCPSPRRSSSVGVSRRAFLQATTALSLAPRLSRSSPGAEERSVILLLLVGGPSAQETFDPKPDAPSDVRGPFGAISTRIPGVFVGEHLPRLAARLDRVTLIRSVYHDEAPIHETGLQLLQTGKVSTADPRSVPLGSLAGSHLGTRGEAPAWAVLPQPLGFTGVAIDQGQAAPGDFATRPFGPGNMGIERLVAGQPRDRREAYGPTEFGRACLTARALVEHGARMVVVNMYPTVFGSPSWDVHGAAPFSTFDDYATEVLPTFDRVHDALLSDLERSGRLGSTLVLATGEFGRTPRIQSRGGRDHWPGVWTAVAAGGGLPGGRVVGASDHVGGEPRDQPVAMAELAGLMAETLGLESERRRWSADCFA